VTVCGFGEGALVVVRDSTSPTGPWRHSSFANATAIAFELAVALANEE